MNRSTVWIAGGVAAMAIAFAVISEQMDLTEHRDLFSTEQPVTEQQLRDRLESEGYATVQIAQDRGNFIVTALKNGKESRFVVNTQTGKDESRWYDDDD
jgi:predicted aspartyl protease